MTGWLRRMLPHAAILICNMYIVFFSIDVVNRAMNFIDNNLTKGLLAALSAIALVNAWNLLRPEARRKKGSGAKARTEAESEPDPAPVAQPVQPEAPRPQRLGRHAKQPAMPVMVSVEQIRGRHARREGAAGSQAGVEPTDRGEGREG